MAEPTSIPLANVPQRGDQSAPGLYDHPAPAAPSFAPDADVNVVSPWGSAGTVKGKDVAPALEAGYQLETQSGTHERRLEKQYGDAPVEAFGVGLLRGGTLGLSDLAARELHLDSAREGMQALQRYNPWASIGGEVVGGFAAPGIGAIGEGAEAAVAGSRFASELAAGGKAARVLARYAPALVRGAAEGAVFGAGGGLSQAALSDDPITAESLVADVGSGILLGAGTGAVLSGASKFLFGGDAAAMMGRAHSDAATPTIADGVLLHGADEVAPRRIGESPESPLPHGPRQAKNEPFDVNGGEVPDNVVPFKRPMAPRDVPDAVVDDFKAKYHKQDTVSRQQFWQAKDMMERGKIAETPELHDAIVAAEDARVAVRKFLPIEGAHDGSRTYEQILDGADLGGSYAKGQGKSIASWTGDNRAIVDAIDKPGFREALVDHQNAIDHVQELLGNKAYPPVVGDHPVFGETVARGGEMPSLGRAGAPAEAAPTQANRIRDMLGIPHEAPRPMRAEAPRPAPAPAVEPTLSKAGPPNAASVGANSLLSRANTLVSSNILGLATGGGLALTTANPLNQWLKDHGVESPFVRSLIAGTIGVIATSKVRGMLGHFTKPLQAALRNVNMGVLARLGEHMEGASSGVDGLLSGKGGKVARRALGGVLGGVSFAMAARPTEKGETEFQKRSAELNATMADPMAARRAIHDKLKGVRGLDPMLADQAEELAFNKLLFLHDKMPKDPGVGPLLGKRGGWQPSDSEVAKWSRYVDTAEHPEHVVEDLAHGTVMPEQVEALETLYPATYQAIRTDIATRATELQRELSWGQRLALSTFFHQPTDGVLRPQNVALMQTVYAEEEAKKDAPPPNLGQIKPPQPTKAQSLAAH